MGGGIPIGNGRIGAMIFGGIKMTGYNLMRKLYGQANQEAIAGRELTNIWIRYASYYLQATKKKQKHWQKKNLWV